MREPTSLPQPSAATEAEPAQASALRERAQEVWRGAQGIWTRMGATRPGAGALDAVSLRGIAGLALTAVASGALLLVLLARLVAASHQVASVPPYPLLGHPAPDFTVALWSGGGDGQSGQTLRLAALRGRPVVVNFWASWCDACTVEAPVLESTYQQYRAQGVVFVGVATGDTIDHARAFVQKYSVTYPIGPDATGAIAVAYGVSGDPETVFIGRDGKIAGKIPGGVDQESLASGVRGIVKSG
jgi:cytochrome c biogenesis protein CcmG/thiol:disulfide interchange protein DsbE